MKQKFQISGRMTDMTTGSPLALILRFALPLVAASMLQQVFSLTDTMVLGIFAGNQAIAVLGVCLWPVWLQVSVLTNLGQAACLLTAVRFGAKDEAALRRAVEINGLTGLAVMKLDVFDGMDTVKLAVGYKVDGKPVDLMPYGADAAARCEPVYEEFPGWKESTFGLTKWEDLPASAQAYLKRLSEVAGCPIALVSTGPDRAQTILLDNPFA